jgi:hypothetical protein
VKQFDVIVGNPPYQKKVGEKKTEPLWDKFITISFKLLKADGHLCMIHPSGWRDVDGPYTNVKNLIVNSDIQYIEFHNVKDSKKLFGGIQIMYDWYVTQNRYTDDHVSTVRTLNGKIETADLRRLPFIPSNYFKIFELLVAKSDDISVDIFWDSKYHHQKPHMSRINDETFKYPCIYTVKTGDIPTFWYSNVNKGHFGVPKFIWGNGVCTSIGGIVDKDGEFGLTEFAYAITDELEHLEDIKTAFKSKKFTTLMKSAPNRNNNFNRKVIKLFKKDFWRHFS